MNNHKVMKGAKYGLLAGLVSTFVTDLVSWLIFAVMGESLESFFALIGRSFLTLINSEAANSVWQGLVLHYSIGILTGLLLGLLTAKFTSLQFNSLRKAVLLSLLITQIEGNTLFYLMSLILNIPQAEMVIMYELGFILHLIWGTCLGIVILKGQRQNTSKMDKQIERVGQVEQVGR